MKWIDVQQKLKSLRLIVFSLDELRRITGESYSTTAQQLSRWVKKGYLIRLRKSLYMLPEFHKGEEMLFFVANKLYPPSYISLETALSYYNIIPETAANMTSVTTRTTRNFTSFGIIYKYRTISPEVFTGYIIEQKYEIYYLLAEPEKALIDYLYFCYRDGTPPSDRIDWETVNKMRKERLVKFINLFHKKRFQTFIEGYFKNAYKR